METILSTSGEAGLVFMGQMNASISHEIKNTLAIIKENAGLLEDLTTMAQQGRAPLDPEKIKGLAQRIAKQIKRADVLANNMNRLAHSVDAPVAQVEVNEALDFMLQITDRLSAYRGAVVTCKSCREKIQLTTCPFLFNHLIWMFLSQAIEWSGDDKKIEVSVCRTPHGVRIDFAGSRQNRIPESCKDLSFQHQQLLESLGAEFQPHGPGGGFSIVIKPLTEGRNRPVK